MGQEENILRRTLADIPQLLARAEAEMASPVSRDLSEKLAYLSAELLAETETLTPEEWEKDHQMELRIYELESLVFEIVKMSKTRFAVIAVNAECCGQRCVVFARRTDGKNKELSLADILAACVTGCASDDVEALIKDWSLGDTLKEIAREFGFQNKAVCAVGLDLI